MSLICPTVTAYNKAEYDLELSRAIGLSNRIHIDIMDHQFTGVDSVDLLNINWPKNYQVDVHLMVAKPMDYLDRLIELKPSLTIIHFESDVNHIELSTILHQQHILTGLALLQETPVENILSIVNDFDHALIFSGHLGHYGGIANLSLLNKVKILKKSSQKLEIGWDGGINDKNITNLISAGVDVLNIGSFIQKAVNPANAYDKLRLRIQ